MFIRSKLFVPGSRTELFEKAVASAADAVSFDLEDAVAPDRKDAARAAVADFLSNAVGFGKLAIVRVNGLSTPWFAHDVDAIVGPGLDVINLPKAESAQDVRAAVGAIERAEKARGLDRPVRLLANIETPKGLRCAAEIACADPRVIGLQLGFADLFLPLGIQRRNQSGLDYVRVAVRMAAGEAGIAAFDAALPDIGDLKYCRAEAEAVRDLGFSGKSCIHPSQIPIVNEVFAPRPDEIAHAAKVLDAARAAAERGVQAFVVDGKLIDAPMIDHARAISAVAPRPEPDAL